MPDDEGARMPNWVRILLAAISAVAIIVVAYRQYPKPRSEQNDNKPAPMPNDKVLCSGWVLDAVTEQAIRNAKVIIEEPGQTPQFKETSTDGYFEAKVNKTDGTVNIRVEENDHDTFVRPVSVDQCAVGPIRLKPKAPPIAASSPSATPTPTPVHKQRFRRDDTEDILHGRKPGPAPR
jgi:hypothetical protein